MEFDSILAKTFLIVSNHSFPFPFILRSATVLVISFYIRSRKFYGCKVPKNWNKPIYPEIPKNYHGRLLRVWNNLFTFQCLEVTWRLKFDIIEMFSSLNFPEVSERLNVPVTYSFRFGKICTWKLSRARTHCFYVLLDFSSHQYIKSFHLCSVNSTG